jgi:hypothetical protein
MTENQLKYLRILNQQKNKGVITNKTYKKEVKYIKKLKKEKIY